MLLTDARRPARTGADGELIPLAEQDRGLWDRAAIAEGLALVEHTLAHARIGPFQVEAAIAAVHAEAADADQTDWPQVVALYELLDRLAPNPMARLSRAAAVGMASGPRAGLALLDELEAGGALEGHHRLAAVRAHLLELAGERAAARDGYRLAARRTTSLPEQRYLTARAARL
jgi:predicted RNA polymerase sigma factor